MASEVMELEARLKDHISNEMGAIIKSIESYSKTYTETARKTTSSTQAMDGAMRRLSDSWNLGKIAVSSLISAMGAMALFNKFTGIVMDARRESQNFMAAQIQLKASLGFTSTTLYAQMAVLQEKLVIDDSVISSIQTMLSYYAKDEKQIKDLTLATLNFSAATGQNASTSAALLGRAIEGDIGMLSRYGIKIDKANTSLSKAELLIDAVNKKFGGQAEALAKSKDWWDKTSLAINDFTKNIGLLFRTGGRSDVEDLALLNYNKKIFEGILADQDKYSPQIIEKAKAFMKEYQENSLIQERRRGSYNNVMEANFKEAEKSLKLTADLQEKLWSLTDSGKVRLLKKQMADELRNTSLTEQQKALIVDKYNLQISEIREKASETERKEEEIKAKNLRQMYIDLALARKRLEDDRVKEGEKNTQDLIDAHEALKLARIGSLQNEYDQELSMLKLKQKKELAEYNQELAMLKLKQEKELAALGDHELAKATLIQAHKQQITNLEDKRQKEVIDADREATKTRIGNIQLASDMSFQTIGDLAKASKASSAVQKGIDIAQATANTAIAVTKALAEGQPWLIPFYIAMGTAQVALISQQKYAGGGIVGGGSPSQGDTVPALLTPGEMVLNGSQQASLWSMLSRPNVSNSSSVNLNISVGSGGTYDMNAARYTVDQLVPILGDALVRAKGEGRLRDYEAAR